MLEQSATSWCTIHRDRISRNLEIAIGLVPDGRKFCAVLKADAYGHGISQVVPLICEQGVETIGITSNAEARAVRDAGFKGTVIRLRSATPQEIEGALDDRVEEQVASVATAQQLHALWETGKLRTRAHLSLNVAGMSRDALEISTQAGQRTCREILDIMSNKICGICSHFSSNDPRYLTQTAERFQQQSQWVFDNSDLNPNETLVHAGSSLTLISNVKVATHMYRCGAILYGILKPDLGFRPTMDIEARVVSVQSYPQGMSVGYDRAHMLEKDCRLACISIGYENGFRRIADGRAAVIVRDTLVPVLGKISMNAIVADVTDVKDISVGDTVKVFGEDNITSILTENVEMQFKTIMAELYTDWGQRNLRIYN